MNNIKESETYKNLQTAYSGESKAYTKYSIFCDTTAADGFEQIASIFGETANNEKEHAEIWLKYLDGIGDTAANLRTAAESEHYEWADMYRSFAETARCEGYNELATKFDMVASIERSHEERYKCWLNEVENGTVFVSQGLAVWECRNCGFHLSAKDAPEKCPVCGYPRAFFEMACECLGAKID